MAKKASSGTTTKKAASKSAKPSPGKAVATTAPRKQSGGSRSSRQEGNSAADMLLKLLESPIVADLLAVGATAALAALAEHRYSARSEGKGAKRALKGAVTAAAAAMGRRLATEFDEIKKSAKAKSEAA